MVCLGSSIFSCPWLALLHDLAGPRAPLSGLASLPRHQALRGGVLEACRCQASAVAVWLSDAACCLAGASLRDQGLVTSCAEAAVPHVCVCVFRMNFQPAVCESAASLAVTPLFCRCVCQKCQCHRMLLLCC